jgi:hypothetical protein
VAEQSRLDVRERQRLAQQRVVQQVNLARGQVVSCAPPAVQAVEMGGIERGIRGVRLHCIRAYRETAQRARPQKYLPDDGACIRRHRPSVAALVHPGTGCVVGRAVTSAA